MTRMLALALAALAVFAIRPAFAGTLDTYRWNARPVVVFGAQSNDAFRQQIALFNGASTGFRERDIVLIPATEGRRDDLRRAYRVAPGDFQVLLIGKDGGVKLRSHEVVSPQEIFRIVDAMPMRRDEMRRR